mgnify:CR=1 FL=1
MPEGPEVRRQAESLALRVSGRMLEGIEVVSGRYLKKPIDGLDLLNVKMPIKIVGSGAHGKFMYFLLGEAISLWSTLGMTGQWSRDINKHTRVKITLNDGEIYFNDQRNFGTIKIVRDRNALLQKLNSLGPDMLAEDVGDDIFITRLRKKNKWSIAKAIMDQSVIAGVGNYVKAESLWLAQMSPFRKVDSLSDLELINLNRAIKQVLRESYKSGGATISTYKSFDGLTGDFSRRFMVYGQKTDPDGNDVVRQKTDDGRVTHWVPVVQY